MSRSAPAVPASNCGQSFRPDVGKILEALKTQPVIAELDQRIADVLAAKFTNREVVANEAARQTCSGKCSTSLRPR